MNPEPGSKLRPGAATSALPNKVLTCLAFDFGRTKTGVAVGNSLSQSAEALTILRSADSDARMREVTRLIAEWLPDILVVGLPRHPDGKPLPNTAACEKFGRQLQGRFNLPVFMVDERLSTQEAARLIRERAQAGKQARPSRTGRHVGDGDDRPDDDDAEAAAVILRQYWAERENS